MENFDNFEELLNEYLPETTKGDVKKGIILKRDSDFAYLEIGGKGEAKVDSSEVADFKDGDEIEVIVTNSNLNSTLSSIPESHDCINPYNSQDPDFSNRDVCKY